MKEQEALTQIESLEISLREEQQARVVLEAELKESRERHAQLEAELEAFRTDIWSVEEVQQALEAVNRSGSEFVIHVDHRIRTALNGLLGMVELLQSTELSSEGLDFALGASSAGHECLEVLNDVLEYCRLDAGHVVVSEELVEVHSLMEDCAGLAREALLGGPVAVELRCGERVPARIQGDGRHLRTVLGHLIENAAQNTTEGQLVLAVDVVGQGPTATIQLSVSDTGCGIAEEDLARVCEAFERANGPEEEGLGLGLTVVRRLVEMMGGAFGLESRLGEGSTAILSFPLEAPVGEGASCPLSEAPGGVSDQGDPRAAAPRTVARVLVVEDNEVNQKVAQGFLKMLGCEAVVAGNGQQALKHLAQGDFDLLLMDCMMPELDGYETTKCIRDGEAGEAYSSAPIIALTADDSPGARQNCLRAGMDDYMTKPVRIERLRSMLRIWLPPALRPPAE